MSAASSPDLWADVGAMLGEAYQPRTRCVRCKTRLVCREIFCPRCDGFGEERYAVSHLDQMVECFRERREKTHDNRYVYRKLKETFYRGFRRRFLRKPGRGSLGREYLFFNSTAPSDFVDDAVFQALEPIERDSFLLWLDDRTTWLDKRVASR